MNTEKKPTVSCFRRRKEKKEPIVMLTAYDAATAATAHKCGIDILLVGDSLGMTVLGYENTIPVTLEQSLHHCAAVRRGAPRAFVVGDMPFMTFHADAGDAMKNAARYLQEAGADAVKIEGGAEIAPLIRRMVGAGIPVMGHIGLLPQRVMVAGGYRLAGKTAEDARRLLADAGALAEAGVFALVLEGIPAEVSRAITAAVSVPTLGIGAGAHCDGQVQVVSDILGLFSSFTPRHAKCYINLEPQIETAFREYVREVKEHSFPGEEHSF